MIKFENPVLVKEMRIRARGIRGYVLQFVWVFILAIILAGFYFSWFMRAKYSGYMAYSGSWRVGKQLFQSIFAAQALLVAFISAAFTAGAITSERERQTFDLLIATVLLPKQIILGKLISSVAFVILLLTTSLPIIAICFMLGGVAPMEVLLAYLVLSTFAFLFGSIGMLSSALLQNTSQATVLTIFAVLFLLSLTSGFAIPGMTMGGVTMGGVTGALFSYPESSLSSLNPFAAVMQPIEKMAFFKISIPLGLVSIILNGLIIIILVTLSISKLGYYSTNKTMALRIQSLIFWLVGITVVFGNAWGMGIKFGSLPNVVQEQKQFVAILAGIGLGLLILVTPIFTTGSFRLTRGRGIFRYFAGGFRIRNLFQGKLVSGLPFMLVWFIIFAVILFLSIKLAGKSIINIGLDWILVLLLIVLAALISCGLLGLFLSSIFRHRAIALGLTYILIIAVIVPPLISLSVWHVQGKPSMGLTYLSNQFLYLNPFLAIVYLAIPDDFVKGMPKLWGSDILPFPLVNLMLYCLIDGVLGLLIFVRLKLRQP